MTAAELLLDLTERLTEADTKLTALAHEKRFQTIESVHLVGKAEGVALALGYVNELRRMTGEDHS